jgi:hypothetical protein
VASASVGSITASTAALFGFVDGGRGNLHCRNRIGLCAVSELSKLCHLPLGLLRAILALLIVFLCLAHTLTFTLDASPTALCFMITSSSFCKQIAPIVRRAWPQWSA